LAPLADLFRSARIDLPSPPFSDPHRARIVPHRGYRASRPATSGPSG